ncbi:MAG: hypothetical protein U0132_23885 [Gemmatimonadaceae bacterium]
MNTVVSPRFSNPFTSIFRFRRPMAILASLFFAATVAGGTAVRWMTPPAPVYAACHAANGTCTGDPTKTAVVDAAYFIPGGGSVTPVEPGAATAWTIDAYWGPATGGLNCNDEIHQATVNVVWNGTNWTTNSFAGTADFIGIGVCNLVSCGSHASAYRLYVDINDPSAGFGNNLRQVVFTAVTVPNGTDFDGSTCALGSSRTPTASTFNGTDSGSFECAFNCSATGATVNLTYN